MRYIGVVLVAASSATAQTTYTWQGGTGDWSSASSWSPSGVPGSAAGDGVVVPSGQVRLTAAPAHPLASIAVTTGGELVLSGGGWTLGVTGAVGVGEGDGGTLTFDDDESPEGFITLSCETLQVERAGVVSAVGTGFPGAPANSGLAGSGPGGGAGAMFTVNAYGGGAGHAGWGCFSSGIGGPPYGELFRPAEPGSGGGASLASAAGGNGGGRVRVVASSRIAVDGRLRADGSLGQNGSAAGSGAGSGGSVWLTTPVLTGSGTISAVGGGEAICASGGRVLVDGLNTTAVPTTLRANPGASCCAAGGTGTVVLANAAGERSLLLDGNPGATPIETPLPALLVTHFAVNNTVTLRMLGDAELRVAEDFLIPPTGTLAIAGPGSAGGGAVIVRAGRVQVDGRIETNGRGWPGAWQVAGGPAHAISPIDGGTVAGSHGGLGTGATMGVTYGAAASPVDLGSGGVSDVKLTGSGDVSGNGGGHVRLFAGTEVNINGAVLAGGSSPNPLCPACAGGAGGSIWIAAPLVSGSGALDATGASGGGGGRIAVYADQLTFSGALAIGSTLGMAGTGQPGTAVSPAADSLVSLDDPPEGFTAEGTLSFSGFALPAGAQFVVFVDDDAHLGDGSDSPNNPDLTEPMRRQTAAASPVTVAGLTAGRTYYWNVVALDSAGGVLAGSALGSFVACAGAGCGGAPAPDSGLTLPDGGIVEVGAPRFVSVPEGSATCGASYPYSREGRPQVVGAGPLHFSVEPPSGASLPSGVSVDADTGELHWTPSSQQEGVQRFDLVVTGPGGTARQPLDVVVVCRGTDQPMVHCGCADASSLVPWVLLALLVRRYRTRGSTRPP